MTSLADKLNPGRFTNMSPFMAAIVGYVLDEDFTTSQIAELAASEQENLVYVRPEGSVGFEGLQSLEDLRRNCNHLLDSADLYQCGAAGGGPAVQRAGGEDSWDGGVSRPDPLAEHAHARTRDTVMQMTVQQWLNSPAYPRVHEPFPPESDIIIGLVQYDAAARMFRIYMGQGFLGTYDMAADRILGGGFLDFILQVHAKEWATGQHLKDLLDCVTCWTYRDYGQLPQVFFDVTGGDEPRHGRSERDLIGTHTCHWDLYPALEDIKHYHGPVVSAEALTCSVFVVHNLGAA